MHHEPIPPMLMLRSFLTVASGYAVSIMSLMVIALILGYTWFPKFIEFLELSPDAQQNIIADDPFNAIPAVMFGAVIVLNSLACLELAGLSSRRLHLPNFIMPSS